MPSVAMNPGEEDLKNSDGRVGAPLGLCHADTHGSKSPGLCGGGNYDHEKQNKEPGNHASSE